MNTKTFRWALNKKINKSRFNYFGIENFDEDRYGNYQNRYSHKSLFKKIKNYIRIILGLYNSNQIKNYLVDLETEFKLLNEKDKLLFVDLVAYRMLGFSKVKLQTNNEIYKSSIDFINSIEIDVKEKNPNFLYSLKKFDLKKAGFDIKLYATRGGIRTCFIMEQYAYKLNEKNIVETKPGDVVLDLGACTGDTALYFAHKVGDKGKIYSFEFIPNNINIFNQNINMNPHLANRIKLVEQPISDKSDVKVYYLDNGPGSMLKFSPFNGQTGETTTVSIDDFVIRNGIQQIDFIKMDIEGAEQLALAGAINTIKNFKPKLAISIYHNMDDFVQIPIWINNLNLGYKLYLDHYTIHNEETVIYAIVL